MNTDRIFISSSNTEEAKKGVVNLMDGISKIKRKFDFFDNSVKKRIPTIADKGIILEKLSNAGVTILILSSDFLNANSSLLEKKGDIVGWNYEELSASLLWNTIKMHNSIIIAYTDEFYNQYLNKYKKLSFPIINDNINNLNYFDSSESDSLDYMEVISLREFLKKPKFYLNKVDKRKVKQATHNLYTLKFA